MKNKDKLYHGLVCLGISLYSTEAAFAAALAKEYGDEKSPVNHWDWLDILADVAGITIGTTIRLAIIHRWNWI